MSAIHMMNQGAGMNHRIEIILWSLYFAFAIAFAIAPALALVSWWLAPI